MAYTLADQLAKLAVLVGDSNTSLDDAFPIATRKKEINRGELHFARDSKALQEYATATVASGSITLPTDWLETHVLVVNEQVISNDFEISIQDYEKYLGDSANNWYYVWGFSGTRSIKFLGSTLDGSSVKLWYFKKPSVELSADADESLLPEEYREASVYYAAAQLLKQIGKVSLAQAYMNEYAAYVSQAVADLNVHFLNKTYPRPDLGTSYTSSVNRVGHGTY